MRIIKPFVIFILTVVAVRAAYSQEIVKSPLGFSMQQPNKWTVTDKEFLDTNAKKVDLSEAALEKLLKESNNSIVVMAFLKYDPQTKEGLIPTIQVRMRPNPTSNFSVFKASFVKSLSKMPFEAFKVEGKPKEVSISGRRAVLVNATYTIGTSDGQTLPTRSRTYAIPYGKQFFQVTFLDNPKDEDCSAEFDDLVQSIKIGR